MVKNLALSFYKLPFLRVPNRNLRDFSLFNVGQERHNRPSARNASMANAISTDNGLFSDKGFLN